MTRSVPRGVLGRELAKLGQLWCKAAPLGLPLWVPGGLQRMVGPHGDRSTSPCPDTCRSGEVLLPNVAACQGHGSSSAGTH